MKSYIAKIETLRPVASDQYPHLNQGYDTVDIKYGVISEDQPTDDGLTRTSFVMWTDGLGDEKTNQILDILNK